MKSFIQYILMVGFPVIVVLGVLQLGRNLKAPVSVGGVWALNPLSNSEAMGACTRPLMWEEAPTLTIAQSGLFISLTFNDAYKTKLEGLVDGTELSGSTTKASEIVPGIQINANIDRQIEPDRLDIALKVKGCAEPISFVGTRLPKIQDSGGH